jgi:hypothetical protein
MTVMRLEVEKMYKDYIETLYLRWETESRNEHAIKSLKEGVN